MEKIEILNQLLSEPMISQMKLSKKCDISIGKCHYILNELEESGFLDVVKGEKRFTYNVTETGKSFLKEQLEILQNIKIPATKLNTYRCPQTAVILSAGRKDEFDTPVGLISLDQSLENSLTKDVSLEDSLTNETLVERTIRILEENGIEKFIIVTGYQSHCYDESPLKSNAKVSFVYNKNFRTTGSMTSLALAAPYVDGDFILLDDDLLIEEKVIADFMKHPKQNCVLLTKLSGVGGETYVEIRNDTIFRISKDVRQFSKIDGELLGMTKISQSVFKEMLSEFDRNENPYQYYEYTLMDVARKTAIFYLMPKDYLWGEMDTKFKEKHVREKVFPMIKEKEKYHLEEDVKQTFAKITGCDISEITDIYRMGGLTNKNYCITWNGTSYAFRIPGVGTEKFIDRYEEGINSQLVSDLGVDKKLYFYDKETGIKIAHMIAQPETLTAKLVKTPENMKKIAELLRTLHQSNVEMKNRFNVFEKIDLYLSCISPGEKLYEGFEGFRHEIKLLKAEYELWDTKIVPSHNDCLPENFIKSGENNKIYLIDWEYSGSNDPMFDVAAICLEADFSADEEELFLQAYFQSEKVSEDQKKSFLINQIFQDFVWSIWATQIESLFSSYGQDRFDRGLKNLEKYMRNYKGVTL